jgi:SulP family sulfate permease
VRLVPDAAHGGRLIAARDAVPPFAHIEVLRIDGSLFFGAIEHVRDEIDRARAERPDVRQLLLVASGVNFIDVAGAEMLAGEARRAAEDGVSLYLCELKPAVSDVLERGGFIAVIGQDRVFDSREDALAAIHRERAA